VKYRLGVVGSPVSHSLTPRMHRAALRFWDLEGTSETVEVSIAQAADVAQLMDSFYGLSVTMPLKELLVPLCQDLDDVATRVGAVNSLCTREGHLSGRNTDGRGFLDALGQEMDLDVQGRHCIVRGSGGSAKAIVDALVEAGASQITLFARNVATAQQLARNWPIVTINSSVVDDVALVVNTVPYVEGATVEFAQAPITWSADAVAIDVIYHPRETPWLAEQRFRGLRVMNGLSMLAHQARHQLEWWFQREIDPSVLLQAVKE
jgi:shikimate dehydrogenase